MSDKPVARLQRENEFLRDIAAKAVRLRNLGRQCDKINDVMEEYWAQNPEATRCGTPALMLEEAFATAMQEFDKSVLAAVEADIHFPVSTGTPRPTTKGQ